ncbi:MAG: tRNA (adenosine(37)-N6)-dimethylallyltransferase MiaA [Clostridia bacterium]|nr:tRNA (adenosine(37)-N6)-dimethylallyltransferase MiaA [Clostridia bacterium]
MKSLLIIGGATGTGKSALAVAVAKKIGGEIISADSMQIYRGLNIGTAKITQEEMQAIPHYMIDIVEPTDPFTAADYKKKASALIDEIAARGKVPILCGGTGLYINAVLYDLSFSGEYDAELRRKLQEESKLKGKHEMHEKLRALDPEAAARLHVNDEKRVLRAIEKALTGGEKEDDLTSPKYPYRFYVTEMPREKMYRRIEKRVDQMIADGLVGEVEGLLSRGIGYDRQCMQAIAYKEWAMREAGLSDAEIIELIKKNTRNYAKRQVTWFKQYCDAIHIDMTERNIEEIAEMVATEYGEN